MAALATLGCRYPWPIEGSRRGRLKPKLRVSLPSALP